ncbi:MAG TPA: amidohydrolase family protein [Hyphomicrobiaceae bacterium]|nr:amidohydrolase family protein [Hyphomicrobiaceae bacterium]
MQPARILDCHAHIIDPARFPLCADKGYKPKADETGTCDAYVEVLDRHGVHGALLVQLSGYGTDNSVLVDALERHPHRFKAIGVVDADIPDRQLQTLIAQGLIGVRFNLVSYDGDALARPESRRLLQRLRAFGLYAQVFADDEQWPAIAAVARPTGVQLLVDHFGIRNLAGGTNQAGFQTVLDLARDGIACIKLSAPFRISGDAEYRDLDPVVEVLLKEVGPGRLMWGSDWPCIAVDRRPTYAKTMAPLDRWLGSGDDRDQVLWHTPARLFGFEGH